MFMDPNAVAAIGKASLALKNAALAFIPITSVALSLRLYVRISIVKGFGLDDLFLIGAQIWFLVFCGYAIKLINYEHDPSLKAAIAESVKTAMVAIGKLYTDSVFFTLFYVLSVIFLKISLAFFYLRIIVQRWQKIVICIAATTMTLYGLGYGFLYVFRCGPNVEQQLVYWAEGKCIPDHTLLVMTYVFGSLDTLTDFIYAFLPIYILWNSNMPMGMKLTAGFLLCMGSVSSICALVRVATLSNLKFDTAFFKQAVQTGLWSIIEPGLAIVATSLAACRPLWRKVFEDTSTGSFIKNTFMFRWSTSKKSGVSSSSGRSIEKPVTIGRVNGRTNGLGFVERAEANKGFKKFNDDEYGVSMASVAVGDESEHELQDLGRLEAQTEFLEDDENDRRSLTAGERKSNARSTPTLGTGNSTSRSISPPNPRARNCTTQPFPHKPLTMLPARLTRSCLRSCCTGTHSAARTFSSTSFVRSADNPIPANDPKDRSMPSPVSSTNAMPLSSEGNMDKPLQESVAEGEERRVMQAPNRKGVWSRSQQAREKAMVGPRFEQMIMYDQPRPMAAIELIHKQPVRWVKERTVKCDGGGGPLGHPRIFINVDRPQICWCTYCGLP
ncbi:NADH-ubiquinone oxidoreductase, partial [Aureobasidium melanogenum]